MIEYLPVFCLLVSYMPLDCSITKRAAARLPWREKQKLLRFEAVLENDAISTSAISSTRVEGRLRDFVAFENDSRLVAR